MPTLFGRTISDAAHRDILELQQKIAAFRSAELDEDRFKAFRLTRGVYGQRQTGVQMFRIKLPFGRLSADQLVRIADISERYTHGNLHLTTRQNIQLHHVKLDDSPAIWAELEEKEITAREACGNTVRNLTGSATAGIDPQEPFDISPYVYAAFQFFLRNPICQDMGRKIKPAFSSSEADSAFVFIHDFGFIPRVRQEDGIEKRGFKVVVGGGLGAQPVMAETAYEFLPEERIIPFMEAAVRVFDRYGERSKRFKARMKYLVKQLGLDGFLELVAQESQAIASQEYWIDREAVPQAELPAPADLAPPVLPDEQRYEDWRRTNSIAQKQPGFYGVYVRVPRGDINAETARKLAAIVRQYAADDIRITVQQGLLFRFVRPESLPHLFLALDALGLAQPGHGSLHDITACPGTDTCNLGVTNSTGLAAELERTLQNEFPDLLDESLLKIKISGCMNSCGQHMIAQIGFHGSSIKKDDKVIPAMQVVLGGGVDPDHSPNIADKVIKLPTKRIPEAVRYLLRDFEAEASEEEYFNAYYRRQGKTYFYQLLKPLADTDSVLDEEFQDWGEVVDFVPEVGVGECAGVTYDLVGTIIRDAEEKSFDAQQTFDAGDWVGSIYNSYSAFVIGAKALLLASDVACNTQIGILKDFDTHYVAAGELQFEPDFQTFVLRMNSQAPERGFAERYLLDAQQFLQVVIDIRSRQLGLNTEKKVISNYYKA